MKLQKNATATIIKHLQTLQKKILDFIQMVGAVFLAITILLRVQLDMRVPVWCTII